MNLETLFAEALHIVAPWKITRVHFDSERQMLKIFVDFERGATFDDVCDTDDGPEDNQSVKQYKAYDTEERSWRHLNFFEHECYIIARTPRIKTDSGNLKLISPPWAGVVKGFTMLFEALLIKRCMHTPVHQVAQDLKLTDRKLWYLLDCYVKKGLLQADYSAVNTLGVDETSAKRGHNYITLFVDLNERKTIHVTTGKDHSTVHDFAQVFQDCNGKIEQVRDISCDMSPAFIKGIAEAFPEAEITFDRFHITKLINEAVDAVRRSEAQTVAELKGSRFAILKNAANRTRSQQDLIDNLTKMNLKSMKAMRIKESFQSIYELDSPAAFELGLKKWYFWATHCRLAPIVKVAKTIKDHWSGVVNWVRSRINNGILEGLNSVIQAAKRKARGYKYPHLKTITLLLTAKFDFGKINPYLPTHFA